MSFLAPTTRSLALAKLSSRELRFLAKKHPQISSRTSALVVATEDKELLEQAMALVGSLQNRSKIMNRTIEAMLPSEIPGPSAVLQARRNAEARQACLREFGALTSAEVAQLAGSRARNRAALANRWRKEGRLFALTHHGQTIFPAFQFGQDGRPFPVIAEVIRAFAPHSQGWQTALWFTASNGWLAGERPVDCLETEPDRVAEAARSEAADLIF